MKIGEIRRERGFVVSQKRTRSASPIDLTYSPTTA